jgi:hypothetical protein
MSKPATIINGHIVFKKDVVCYSNVDPEMLAKGDLFIVGDLAVMGIVDKELPKGQSAIITCETLYCTGDLIIYGRTY